MKIEFDLHKAAANLKKHGINMNEIEAIFYDDRAITIEDRNHPEERFITIGMDDLGRILVVTYHYRGEHQIRVISARLAQPHERRTYET